MAVHNHPNGTHPAASNRTLPPGALITMSPASVVSTLGAQPPALLLQAVAGASVPGAGPPMIGSAASTRSIASVTMSMPSAVWHHASGRCEKMDRARGAMWEEGRLRRGTAVGWYSCWLQANKHVWDPIPTSSARFRSQPLQHKHRAQVKLSGCNHVG
jgi:hypothetical protein